MRDKAHTLTDDSLTEHSIVWISVLQGQEEAKYFCCCFVLRKVPSVKASAHLPASFPGFCSLLPGTFHQEGGSGGLVRKLSRQSAFCKIERVSWPSLNWVGGEGGEIGGNGTSPWCQY
jgi:hypothetical protein